MFRIQYPSLTKTTLLWIGWKSTVKSGRKLRVSMGRTTISRLMALVSWIVYYKTSIVLFSKNWHQKQVKVLNFDGTASFCKFMANFVEFQMDFPLSTHLLPMITRLCDLDRPGCLRMVGCHYFCITFSLRNITICKAHFPKDLFNGLHLILSPCDNDFLSYHGKLEMYSHRIDCAISFAWYSNLPMDFKGFLVLVTAAIHITCSPLQSTGTLLCRMPHFLLLLQMGTVTWASPKSIRKQMGGQSNVIVMVGPMDRLRNCLHLVLSGVR